MTEPSSKRYPFPPEPKPESKTEKPIKYLREVAAKALAGRQNQPCETPNQTPETVNPQKAGNTESKCESLEPFVLRLDQHERAECL
ncbi:MAG: hypothetical protein ACRERU_06330 [Methylococcales bacterium]